LPACFDCCQPAGTERCLDAWKRDCQRFFDLVFPRLDKAILFLGHHVVNKAGEGRLPQDTPHARWHPQHHRVAVGRGHLNYVETVLMLEWETTKLSVLFKLK